MIRLQMPFPASARVLYSPNPLAEVVCQFTFPQSLQIASEAPAEFQRRLRGSYPLLQVQGGPNAFGPGSGVVQQGPGWLLRQGFQIGGAAQPAYLFSNEDETRTVTLTSESLAFAESRYERWEHFKAEIDQLVGHLTELYEPPFFTRVGLRYQDLIDRKALDLVDVPWKDLLNPGFAGLGGSDSPVADEVLGIGGVVDLSLPEPSGARVRLQHGLNETPNSEGHQYAIDSDFFLTERSEAADALSCLDQFNVHAGNLFRWAISDRLSTALNPKPIPDRSAA